MPQGTPPAAPAPPAPLPPPTVPAPIASDANGTITGATGMVFQVPTTRAEIGALRNMRSELSDQLQSAAGRREELARELATADPGARAGIQSRIDLLDARILKIEADIATTGDLLARSLAGSQDAGSGDVPPFSRFDMELTPIFIVVTLFVLAPIAVAYARGLWRRGSVQRVETVIERENAERLARLEQAVDTIAVEVERISEGQRFVTRLLNESQQRDKALLERGGS